MQFHIVSATLMCNLRERKLVVFTVAIKLARKLPGKIISKTCEGALCNQIYILRAIWVMNLMEWLLVVESVF